jgi:hypothetical protein
MGIMIKEERQLLGIKSVDYKKKEKTDLLSHEAPRR